MDAVKEAQRVARERYEASAPQVPDDAGGSEEDAPAEAVTEE
jgi:hypothetical protein